MAGTGDYPALLAWFNYLPPFSRDQDFTNEDLGDGTKIWQALHELNPNYFEGELPDAPSSSRRRTSSVQNLQNIKRIYKSLRQYLVEECGASTPPGFDDVNLNLLGEGASKTDLATLLKTLLCIAVLHPSEEGNEPYLLVITQLPEEYQGILAKLIQDLQEAEESAAHAPKVDKSSGLASPREVDVDFRNEEQTLRLLSEKKELERDKILMKRELDDQEERLTRLQANNSVLQEELKNAQTSLETATQSADQGFRLRDLEAKNKGQDDYIADLEERFQGISDKESRLQSEINKLRKANEKVQPLQDEVDELKASRDSLARRANALERYKHKLQSVQEVENENRALRRELEEVRYLSQEGDGTKQNNSALQREVMELKMLMSNTEIQLVEATNRRKQMEYDNEELLRRLQDITAQRERDQEAMSQLQDKPPRFGHSDGDVLDLDSELEGASKHQTERTQELKQERQYRASNNEAAQRMALQQRLNEQKTENDGLRKLNLELVQKNVGLEGIMKEPEADEQSVDSLKSSFAANTSRSQKAYMEMQEKLDSLVNEAASLRKEKDTFETQVTDAEKTIATYDQEKVEALETLKELNSNECVGLRAKIIAYEETQSDLRLRLGEHHAMLIEAFKQTPNPLPQAVVEAPEAPSKEDDEDAAASQQMEQLLEEVQSAKGREESQHQELERRERAIEELRTELRTNAEKAAPALLKASEQAALKQENENLRRENKLMATAYYDLGSRLQMNNVSLQRRQDAPKSFLNRQRLLVNQAATVRTK